MVLALTTAAGQCKLGAGDDAKRKYTSVDPQPDV